MYHVYYIRMQVRGECVSKDPLSLDITFIPCKINCHDFLPFLNFLTPV